MEKSKVKNRKLISNRMLCKTQSHDWEHCSGNNNFIAFWDDIKERVALKCPYWIAEQEATTSIRGPTPLSSDPPVSRNNSIKEESEQLEFKWE